MCLPPRDEVAKTGPRANHPHRRRFSRPPLPLRQRRQPVVEVVEEGGVTFQEEDQVHMVPTTLSRLEADQDRRELWYNRADIKEFRRQAQVLSKKCRLQREPRKTQQQEGDDQCTRGLELRMSLHRQDRKQQIVKRILAAQDDDCTAEELSQIAQQHSVWSRKLALAQAHKDYYTAYHPNLTSVLPEMPAMLDCSRDLSRKRSLLGSSFEQSGRRVRCRMGMF